MSHPMLDKMLYNTVLCQTFSPCGQYLVAGNIYGHLAVFDLDLILNPVTEQLTPDYNKPKFRHDLESSSQICSLATTEKFLVVGLVNEILGWDWKQFLNSKRSKPMWIIPVSSNSSIEHCDVNSLWFSEEDNKLYAGCGDSKIYVCDLEDGRKVAVLEGHSDYIHSVHGNGQQIVSAGEDGAVKLWDTRSNKSHNSIEPHKKSKLARPDIGKWIGSASLGDDWIVCGGGPRLALWHLRSLDATTVFDIPDHGINVSFFHDDCVIAGGTAKHLYQLSYSGDIRVEIPVSSTTVYSVVLRTSPNNVLSIAGSSSDIDLCTTFNYRDQVLRFR